MRLSLVYRKLFQLLFFFHSVVNQAYYCLADDRLTLGLTLSELLKHVKGVSLHFSIYGVNGDHHKFLLFNAKKPFSATFLVASSSSLKQPFLVFKICHLLLFFRTVQNAIALASFAQIQFLILCFCCDIFQQITGLFTVRSPCCYSLHVILVQVPA